MIDNLGTRITKDKYRRELIDGVIAAYTDDTHIKLLNVFSLIDKYEENIKGLETPKLGEEWKEKSIDKVTVQNLEMILRMCSIHMNPSVIDKVIDIVELIEEKGDTITVRDITELQTSWEK